MLDNLTQFEPTIIKLAKSYNIPSLEWEDIAQELRIHLWLKQKSAKKPIKNYQNWAYISCRNKIRDLARRYQNQKNVGNLDNLDETKIIKKF